jgi:Flp pilus assembly protein TadG
MHSGELELRMKSWKSLLSSTGGAEIAETAAVLPILFTLLLAIFFFGRAYNIYGTLTQAAQQGVRAAVAPSCASCTNAVLTSDQIATTIVGPVLQASRVNVNQVSSLQQNLCACGTTACGGSPVACDNSASAPIICVQRNVSLGSAQQCGTAVSFQYPYGFNLPFQSFTLQLKASAQMQSEQ